MTASALSLLSVPPGAPLPSTGTGAAAPAVGSDLFANLLAGLAGQTPDSGSSVSTGADPLDPDSSAREAQAASLDAGLAVLLIPPGSAPPPVTPTSAASDGEAAAPAAPRPILASGLGGDPAFGADAALASASDADGSPPPVMTRPDGRSDEAPAAGPSPAASPADQPRPAAPPPASPGPVQAATPSPAAASVAATAPAVEAASETAAVADVAASSPPPRAAAADGEARRPAAPRGERRADNAARPTTAAASPAKQAAQAALANDGAPDAVDADAFAEPDIVAVETVETPETRQPSAPAEARAQIGQAAAAAVDAPEVPRGSSETVARMAADIVRKLEGQSTRFDLELNPRGMGRVDVAIEIDRDGRLTAAMSFDSAQSAADLRGRAGELRLALEQAGFDVSEGGLTFDLASGGAGPGGREAGQQQQDRAWTGRAFQRAQTGAEEIDLSLATPSTSPRWTRSGVDIRI